MINKISEAIWQFKMACVKCGQMFTYANSDVITCSNTNIPYIQCPQCSRSVIPYHIPDPLLNVARLLSSECGIATIS